MKGNSVSLIRVFAILLAGMVIAGCGSIGLDMAAAKGDINKMNTLLAQGVDVNEKDSLLGLTALYSAAAEGQIEAVRFLFEKGADITVKNRNGSTAICIAAENGHIDVVRLLLEKGAEINAKDEYGNTALSLAARKGHINVARLLLEKGADINIASVDGRTALKEAELNGHTSIVRLLKQAEEAEAAKWSSGHAPIVVQPARSEQIQQTPIVKSDVDELPSVHAKPQKNSYAIVIGIEKYRQRLPNADHAVNDAKLMTEYLTKVMGYPAANVVTLTNDLATKSDFEKYFERWLFNNVEKDSSVFVYFSGHGAPNVKTGDAYLVPYDGDPSFIEQTGYPLKRLYESLNKLPAKEVIVVLDSCFSGAGGKSVIAQGARPLVMSLEQDFHISRNMVVMSASSGSQISSTYEEKGHGLFTYFLLKGIKDGKAEVGELFDYLKPNVGSIARKIYNNEQTPQLIAPDKQKVFLRN